jgi:hypothetical protein
MFVDVFLFAALVSLMCGYTSVCMHVQYLYILPSNVRNLFDHNLFLFASQCT